MDAIVNYIKPELLILVPVLYFVGMGFKNSKTIADNRIPILLGVCGIVLSSLYVVATSALENWQAGFLAAFTAATQGILAAGCSVYIDQIIKQKNKPE